MLLCGYEHQIRFPYMPDTANIISIPNTRPRNTRYQAGRYPLLGPDFHRLDRTSFAWRTHSITSSARASSVDGTSIPSAWAVCRLMTNSNVVGCITGRSDGFSPLRMRPV